MNQTGPLNYLARLIDARATALLMVFIIDTLLVVLGPALCGKEGRAAFGSETLKRQLPSRFCAPWKLPWTSELALGSSTQVGPDRR